jgi:hypothetical protein
LEAAVEAEAAVVPLPGFALALANIPPMRDFPLVRSLSRSFSLCF